MTDFSRYSEACITVPQENSDIASDDEKYLCDVVFSFDTTGSMRSVIDSVRTNLSSTVEKLFSEVDGIRIGIIVHGDYCDYPRMMWKLDLTKNVEAIKEFISNSINTGGGDAPECYEFVLLMAQSFDWKSDVKVLVVIGDETPHEKGYILPKNVPGFENKLHIDWNTEVEKLKQNKITVFSCHAMPTQNRNSLHFYKKISEVTNGMYFHLDELQAFQYYMVTICLKAADDAEIAKLMKLHEDEINKQLESLSLENLERKEELTRELYETKSALASFESGETFTSPAFNTSAKKVQKSYNYVPRTNTYIKSTPMRYESKGTRDMISKLYDADDEDEEGKELLKSIKTIDINMEEKICESAVNLFGDSGSSSDSIPFSLLSPVRSTKARRMDHASPLLDPKSSPVNLFGKSDSFTSATPFGTPITFGTPFEVVNIPNNLDLSDEIPVEEEDEVLKIPMKYPNKRKNEDTM